MRPIVSRQQLMTRTSADESHSNRVVDQLADPELVALIDAVVAGVDIRRDEAIERIREALDRFGGAWMFDAELRLNGVSSGADEWCICGGEIL